MGSSHKLSVRYVATALLNTKHGQLWQSLSLFIIAFWTATDFRTGYKATDRQQIPKCVHT